jgi:putative PEP-CTERM system TPR-repeat lipoprotein
MADHDWAKAQEGLREILSRYPDNKQAQMMLGIVHKESGNLEQAEMYLSAVVAGEPDNVMARRLLAETQLKLNKGREARQVLAPLITGADSDIGAILMAADVNLRLGNIDDAISLLERSVAADPGNLDLQLQLAFAYLRSGDTEKVQTLLREIPATANDDVNFRRACLSILTAMSQARSEDAINESRELLSRWPDRATAYRLAGSIAMATGDYLSARKSLRKALELEPDDIASLRFLAELDRLENDIESEKEGYESIIVTRPGDIRSMIALARLAMDAQQPDVAREWLEKARSADATSLSPRLLLGSMALEDEDFQEAETLAREAMKIDPNHSLAYSVLGFAQLGQGMFAEAEVSFGRALEIQPDEQSHRLNLSRSQAMRGNTELAMATLEEALDQSLHNVPSAAFLAFLKAKSGDMRGALEVATTLRDNLPGEAAPHALMAELHVTAGNSLAASSAYERALELENTSRYAVRAYQIRAEAGMSNQLNSLLDYLEERPFDADMRAYLAQAFHRLGDTGEAISQYERILIEDPGNYVVANNLAWHYFQAKDPRAEMIARQAYGLNPESGAVADTLGWILVSQGAVEDGISILRSAVKLADGEPEYRYHLAAGLSAAGRTSEARKLLLELLAGGDEFSSRREAEALLQTL